MWILAHAHAHTLTFPRYQYCVRLFIIHLQVWNNRNKLIMKYTWASDYYERNLCPPCICQSKIGLSLIEGETNKPFLRSLTPRKQKMSCKPTSFLFLLLLFFFKLTAHTNLYDSMDEQNKNYNYSYVSVTSSFVHLISITGCSMRFFFFCCVQYCTILFNFTSTSIRRFSFYLFIVITHRVWAVKLRNERQPRIDR